MLTSQIVYCVDRLFRRKDHGESHKPFHYCIQSLQVVHPHQRRFKEYIRCPASKWRGYDAQGLLCYYRHHFAQWDYSFDDEDEPCMRMLRSESFEAWRCLDGQWLRRVQSHEASGPGQGAMHDSGFERVPAQQVPRL